MNTAVDQGILKLLGQPYGGGIACDVYMHGQERRLLIVAHKAAGEFRDVRYSDDYNDIPGAKSYFDGLANTEAMASAGSKLAAEIRALRLGGKDDWHLGAVDQAERLYFRFKPTTAKNGCWARDGINLSAIPAQWPYTPEFPLQTEFEAFRAGGAEAFEISGYYWTSTQPAAYSDFAWIQYFDVGYQNYRYRTGRRLARAVRSEPI